MTRRLSLGTPHRLTQQEQVAALAMMESDLVLRADMLAVLRISEDDWLKMPAQARLQALAVFENVGAYTATWTKAAQARRDFASEANLAREGGADGQLVASPAVPVNNDALLDAILALTDKIGTMADRIQKLESNK